MTTVKPNGELERRLQSLRAERGDRVSIDEVAEVVASIMSTMQGDVSAIDLALYSELDELAKYIHSAKAEIASLCPDDIRHKHLPAAADQLDAIVLATEEATGKILEAAENIETEAGKLDAPGINDQVTRIFEACSFQDLTGQRISKVVTTLKVIEERIDRLVRAFGDEVARTREAEARRGDGPAKSKGDNLTGPQLPGEGNKQEDIDALLARFD